jgi:phage-related protein
MSKGLTASQIEQISKTEVKTRILLTLRLRDSENTVIRIIENDTLASLSYGGETYLAAKVKRASIDSSIDGGPQKVNIKISNINRYYSAIIASEGDVLTNSVCSIDEVIYVPPGHDQLLLEDNGALKLEDGGYLLLENDYIIGSSINIFEGYMNNIQLTETEFSFDVEKVLGGYSAQSPNTTFDVNCQWLFKDERCQYSGVGTFCDKTFATCDGYGNTLRFGGYPSIPSELIIRK